MKYGVVLPQFGKFASQDAIRRMAQGAEALGWDSVWFTDHIVVPNDLTGRMSETFYELFATMGYVAGCTSRVKLGTTVVVLPYRHPLLTAKQVATLDHLSGGRIILGVAFGWNREEYEMLGVPFAKRGQRADECLAAMKECWTAEHPRFEGEFYRFSDFAFSPKPLQRPHPPIWIGGNDHRSLQRAVDFGDGWHPISGPRLRFSIPVFQSRIDELKRLAEAKGRDPGELAISLHTTLAFDMAVEMEGDPFTLIGSTDEITRNVETCRELGVSHLILSCWYGIPSLLESGTVDSFLRTLERFDREVRPRL